MTTQTDTTKIASFAAEDLPQTFSVPEGSNTAQTAELTAQWILDEFRLFYADFLYVPLRAKQAFEERHHSTSIWLSRHRLSLYSTSIKRVGEEFETALPELSHQDEFLNLVVKSFNEAIAGLYEADVASAYIHSVIRAINRDEWRPIEYGYSDRDKTFAVDLLRIYQVNDQTISPGIISEVLQIPGFKVPYRNASSDSVRIAARINRLAGRRGSKIARLEMIDGGFFRNRGAYLIGQLSFEDGSHSPCMLALLNDEAGIYCDAVILNEHLAHNLFSSTLANFHVTTRYYHELCEFLYSMMPNRALGLYYSTIGYNHLGKVAVIKELKKELAESNGVFDTAIGEPGTVAIGFAGPDSGYNLKVIRNHPTRGYKWGTFDGIDSVKAKYSRVHEINRTGSMLDNIIYFNIALEEEMFSAELLEELLSEASETVSRQHGSIVFKYLIVQPRLTPLPVFLETANDREEKVVIESLGDCIKNNAAANIFNKDLDARNYGVSHFLKVYLFDYDALEDFVDVKIRSNLDRFDGEEDIPDWYFEDGVIFLPEEIEAGLCIRNRDQRLLFRSMHGDLMTTGYWETLQGELSQNHVPSIKVYPDSCKLKRSPDEL